MIDNSRTMADVARSLGVVEQTLGNWVKAYREAARRRRAGAERIRARPDPGTGAGEPRTEDGERIPGKIGGLLREETPVNVKYAFIAGEEGNYPVNKMCSWAKVSRSGFYEWRDRATVGDSGARGELAALVRFAFEHSDGTTGYRRIHAQLARWGHHFDDETMRSGDAGAGPGGVPAAAVSAGHDHRRGRDGTAGSGAAGLHRDRAGLQARRGHHLHPDLGGLAVLGDRAGLLFQEGDRATRWPTTCGLAGRRGVADGGQQCRRSVAGDTIFHRTAAVNICLRNSRPSVRLWGCADPSAGRAAATTMRGPNRSTAP